MEQNAKHFCMLFGALSEIPIGEQWQVEVDEDFVYEELPDFFEKSSALLSAYTQAMKAFQSKYASEREIDEKTTYLFFFNTKAGDRNVNGFMPRNKQFGYIFTQGFSSEENLAIAVAHELGHGQFLLKHPFDNSYKLLQNGLPENLMDYGNGVHLAKWQWDIIKSPGVVNRVFEREGDAMMLNGINVLEGIAQLRRCYLHKINLKISKKSGKLDAKTDMFNYKTKDALFLIYEKEGALSNITFTKEIKSANAYPSGYMHQIKINDFGVINCVSEEDRDVIYDFLTNKKNNAILSNPQSVSLSGKIYSFETIYCELEKLKAQMLKSEKDVSELDNLIVDVPLIQWQLGWNYASIFYYNWLIGGGNIQADKLLTDWLQSWPVFKARINEYETTFISKLLNKPFVDKQTQEYSAINAEFVSSWVVQAPLTNFYTMSDLRLLLSNIKEGYVIKWEDRKYTNFSITTIAANEDSKTFNAWVGAFGSVSMQHCFKGQLIKNIKKEAVIKVDSTVIYVKDGFDFLGNQWLGVWNVNVFKPQIPHATPITNMTSGNFYLLTNDRLNDFNRKYGIGKNFDIFIQPISTRNLFNKIIINKETNEITYQK